GGELEARLSGARRTGIDKTRIVIDPGLGFGKRKEQNSLILSRLGQLAALDFPIMVGPSRKSFLAQSDSEQTKFANAAAVTAAILRGAHIRRVPDVRGMRAAADVGGG